MSLSIQFSCFVVTPTIPLIDGEDNDWDECSLTQFRFILLTSRCSAGFYSTIELHFISIFFF